MKARARTDGTLLDIVIGILATATKTTVRKFIKHGRVAVEGKVQVRPDLAVRAGQLVEVLPAPAQQRGKPAARAVIPPPFPILFEDEHLIAVDKPAGLLSIATDREPLRTLYRMISDYVEEVAEGRGRIFIVHRLDRDVSGVMVFAKDAAAKRKLQDDWASAEKIYHAEVVGAPPEAEGTVRSWLRENSALRVSTCGKSDPDAREAVTHYRLLRHSGPHSVLEVRIETGRKHQIRVHLASLGCPIVGDRIYGAGGSGGSGGSIGLHAHSLTFTHPVSGERVTVTSPLPSRLKGPRAGRAKARPQGAGRGGHRGSRANSSTGIGDRKKTST